MIFAHSNEEYLLHRLNCNYVSRKGQSSSVHIVLTKLLSRVSFHALRVLKILEGWTNNPNPMSIMHTCHPVTLPCRFKILERPEASQSSDKSRLQKVSQRKAS